MYKVGVYFFHVELLCWASMTGHPWSSWRHTHANYASLPAFLRRVRNFVPPSGTCCTRNGLQTHTPNVWTARPRAALLCGCAAVLW